MRTPLAVLAVLALVACAFAAYDHDVAVRLVFHSGITYCDNHTEISSWSCPGCTLNLPGVQTVGLSEKNPEDNFAYVAVDTQFPTGRPTIVVSFRGSHNLKNWLEDATIWYDKTVFQNLTNVRIHTGFEKGWRNLRAEVHRYIGQALRQYPTADIASTSGGCPRATAYRLTRYFPTSHGSLAGRCPFRGVCSGHCHYPHLERHRHARGRRLPAPRVPQRDCVQLRMPPRRR
jgi:hypothetical protein